MDIQAAIAGAAGNNDGAGSNDFGIDKPQRNAAGMRLVSLQADHLIRDRELRTEFLCLIASACHQRCTADASRETEIILDPCRCASLAADHPTVQYEG